MAAAKLSKEKPGQTIQPTVLVHEAYVRLVKGDAAQQRKTGRSCDKGRRLRMPPCQHPTRNLHAYPWSAVSMLRWSSKASSYVTRETTFQTFVSSGLIRK
jgi:hypothetical protein